MKPTFSFITCLLAAGLALVPTTQAAINVTIYELGDDVILESEAGTVAALPPAVANHDNVSAEFLNSATQRSIWTGGSGTRIGFGSRPADNALVFSGNMFVDPPNPSLIPQINEVESSGPSIGFRNDENWQFVFFDVGNGYSPISNFPASFSRWGNTSLKAMGLVEGDYTISTSGGTLMMNVEIIPEPSSYALIGGLLALGLVLTRRR